MYGIRLIKSPNTLKNTIYSTKNIVYTGNTLNLFTAAEHSQIELQEIEVQNAVNYDDFYSAPIPEDFNSEELFDTAINKKQIIVASVAILVLIGSLLLLVKMFLDF